MAERLTTCKEITSDTDMTQEWGYSHIYKRLAHYEDLEEQGRLLELPCAIGTKIYGLDFPECDECVYKGGPESCAAKCPLCVIENEVSLFTLYFDLFYKPDGTLKEGYYLTREEAEAALKEQG